MLSMADATSLSCLLNGPQDKPEHTGNVEETIREGNVSSALTSLPAVPQSAPSKPQKKDTFLTNQNTPAGSGVVNSISHTHKAPASAVAKPIATVRRVEDTTMMNSVQAEQRRLMEEAAVEEVLKETTNGLHTSPKKAKKREKAHLDIASSVVSSAISGTLLGREQRPEAKGSPEKAAEVVYKLGMDAVGTDLLEHHGYSNDTVLARWQFKWSPDADELHGPYNSEEMMAWADDGYFEEGLWIRRFKAGHEPGPWMPWFEALPESPVKDADTSVSFDVSVAAAKGVLIQDEV